MPEREPLFKTRSSKKRAGPVALLMTAAGPAKFALDRQSARIPS
jgi:hypothetical protein